jgi:ribose transport system substrate-binding protein
VITTARRTSRCLLAAGAVVVVLAAACSSSKSSTSSSTTAGATATTGAAAATTTTVDALAAAQADVTKAEQGSYTDVDPTPRPAVKGKHIVVISDGQQSISASIPSNAAVAAAKAIGWQVDLYDAKLDTSSYSGLVRQAIAAHADGIIVDAIDCDQAQQAFQEAKAANIAVVGIYAFDCTDSHAGNEPTGLFSGTISYGARGANLDTFTESYGADQANYIIAASHNTAKIIDVYDPEFTVLYWVFKGFNDTIAASGGSKVVDTLNITVADLLAGKVTGQVQAELLRHPEATWLKSTYTYATLLGVAPALAGKAGSINVMGSEGFTPELDLIRKGVVTAVSVVSSEWEGWAAVDTMNSVFRHEKPVDSGIGWVVADKAHIPASGPLNPTVDFKSEYMKAWGVA